MVNAKACLATASRRFWHRALEGHAFSTDTSASISNQGAGAGVMQYLTEMRPEKGVGDMSTRSKLGEDHQTVGVICLAA